MADAKRQLMPFWAGAVVRESEAGKLVYKPGDSDQLQVRKVGFVSYFICHFEMDVALGAGTPVLHEDGLFNLIRQAEVNVNINSANPTNVNGSDLRLLQLLDRYGFDTRRGGVGSSSPANLIYAAPIVAGATNKWRFSFILPVAMNTHREMHVGTLPMYARGVNADITIRWNELSRVVAGVTATGTNGTLVVEQVYFAMPNPNAVAMPDFFVIKRRSDVQGGVLNGANKINIPQEGRLLALAHTLRIAGSRKDDILSHALTLNDDDTPRNQSLKSNRLHVRRNMGIDLDAGHILHNFMDADATIFSGSARRTFDTARIATFDSVLNIQSDTLSANPSLNSIGTLRILIQPLLIPSSAAE